LLVGSGRVERVVDEVRRGYGEKVGKSVGGVVVV
jgi:hypothetical protein